MEKLYKKIRCIFWLIVFLFLYIKVLWTFFIDNSFLLSVIWVVLAMMALLFLAIDFKSIKKRYLLLGVGILLVGAFLVFSFSVKMNRYTILAYFLLNIGFLILLWVKNSGVFNAWNYFTGGAYMFSLCIALAYSSLLLGTSHKYTINCEKLYGGKIVESLEDNVKTSNIKIPEKRYQTDIGERTPKLIRIEKKNFFGRFIDSSKDVLGDIGVPVKRITTTSEHIKDELMDIGKGIAGSTKNFLNNIDKNRKELSVSSCKYIGIQIQRLYSNNYVQLVLILLVSFVFLGLIRFIFWIATLFTYIIFKILQGLRIYRIVKRERLVDDID